MGISIVGSIVSGVVDRAAEAALGQNTSACNLVKGALKIGGAVVTCDLTAGVSGAKDLLAGAVGAAPAAVEFMGSIGIGGLAFGPIGMCAQAVARKLCFGYTPAPISDAKVGNAVALLQRNFDLLDTAAGWGSKDGLIGTVDLAAAMGNPQLPPDLREACRFLLSNSAIRHELDVAAGVGSIDGRIARSDLEAMARRLGLPASCPQPLPPVQTPPSPSCPSAPVPTTPTPPTGPNPPPVSGTPQPTAWDGQLDAAVASLDRYFDFLDTAAGIDGKDGLIGRIDLEAALRNPNVPAHLANACCFLLRNPAAWNQVDVGAGVGRVDGHITRADIEAVRRRRAAAPTPAPSQPIPTTPTQSKPPSTSSSGKTTSTSGSGKTSSSSSSGKTSSTSGPKTATSKTSKLSGMSAEQIVEAMLTEMLNGLDSQLIDKAKELEKAEEAKTKAKSGSASEKQATADYNRIYADLQKIMERRKQMYELASNLSKLGHEMARTAIGNIGRA